MEAGVLQAQQDFVGILTRLGRKFEISLVKWAYRKDFEIRIRTALDRDNDDLNIVYDQWVDMFSSVTHTVWVKKSANTGPRFRKTYQCWTQGSDKIIKELLFDSRRCQGILDISVSTRLSQTKIMHIPQGLNVVVKINFKHLHLVKTRVPYSCFVHTCNPRPETIIPDLPNDVASLQIKKIKTDEEEQQKQEFTIQITEPDLSLSDPLLLYEPAIKFETT